MEIVLPSREVGPPRPRALLVTGVQLWFYAVSQELLGVTKMKRWERRASGKGEVRGKARVTHQGEHREMPL